jgi:flagellin
MGLRIQNNIEAMNTHRQLQVAQAGVSKSLERLSSGYRINKAADDAAGLAISQNFRADIAAFKVASRNTTEANAMLQVAEGAMDQMANMLTRLNELATQSASDNVTNAERTKIDSEAQKLILEIDRIADSTKYGSSKLLDGTFGGVSDGGKSSTFTEGYIDSDYKVYKYSDNGADTAAATFASSPLLQAGTWTMATSATDGDTMELTNGSLTVTGNLAAGGLTLTFDEVGVTLTFAAQVTTAQLTGDSIVVEADGSGLSDDSVVVGSDAAAGTYTLGAGSGTVTLTGASGSQSFTGLSDGAQTLDFSTLGISIDLASDYDTSDAYLNGMTVTVSSSSTKTFQIGAENNADNQLTVSVGDTTTGSGGLNIASLTLATKAGAQAALDSIGTAVDTLGTRRSDIGAYMNRLSFAAANLSTVIENVQAAESVIRDVDMAAEMTAFTKNQILTQASTAMLAQANQASQALLSLFQ